MTAISTTTPVDVVTPAARPATYVLSKGEKRFIGLQLLIATAALSIGSFFGPMQALEFSGLTIGGRDLYALFQPLLASYYQGLTLHGVLNALIWTTFFITGFFTLTVTYGLRRPLAYPKLGWLGFIVMTVGLLTAA